MKNTKIKLNSRHLKVGDKIIRVSGGYSDDSYEVISKSSTHIKLKGSSEVESILPIKTWNDNWVRYTLD